MSEKVYFTPGPSQMYGGLMNFMQDAWNQDVMSISHRGEKFTDIYRRTDQALRDLMDIPTEYSLMFLGSATEAMERLIQGLSLSRTHHFVNGAFSDKWRQIADQLGRKTSVTKVESGMGFESQLLVVPQDAELVCLTQNETSTGVILPVEDLENLKLGSDGTLIALDVVSSAPIIAIPWKKVDAVFFSVQKNFGLPAGLGVLVTSPKVLARSTQISEMGYCIGSYHGLPYLAAAAIKFQTPATPNVLGIYLLGRVARDMVEKGIYELKVQNIKRASQLYEVLDSNFLLTPFVSEIRFRSPTVIVGIVKDGNRAIHRQLQDLGLIIGKGYKPHTNEHIRIANFPAIDDMAFHQVVDHLRSYTEV